MDVALLAARVLLALVFGVAGLAKLADRAEAQQALRDFGLPAWLAGPLSVVLPLIELGVALALLPALSAWWGAVGAHISSSSYLPGAYYDESSQSALSDPGRGSSWLALATSWDTWKR